MPEESKHKKPPRFASWALKKILPDEKWETPLGDFEEFYNAKANEKTVLRAQLWYWSQIFGLLPEKIYNSIWWSFVMINNYLKIALRNTIRNKGYSFINISGLAIGMTCCILILLWVQDELSYDQFHENGDYLYFVATRQMYNNRWYTSSGTPPAAGPALKAEYPEIQNTARLQNGTMPLVVRYGDKLYTEPVRSGDFSLLEMFTFPLVKGNLVAAFSNPYSIFLTERMAEKYFGNDEPVGKILHIENRFEFTVAGVLQNMPDNSMIRFDFLVPMEFREQRYGIGSTQTWTNLSFQTFVQLQKNSSPENVNPKIENRIIEGNGGSEQVKPFLRKYNEIYLYGFTGAGGNIIPVRIFSLIAIFILIIACINFMNLSTARSGSRAKEVGMRKVVGAHRKDVIKQFFGESILLAFISLAVAVILAKLLIPAFNNLSGKQLDFSIIDNFSTTVGLIGIALFTGIVAGSYPALFLSSFKPALVLKGSAAAGSKGSLFRKILVVIQFVISIALIVCTVVVFKQLNYMGDVDLGFKKEQIVYIQTKSAIKQQYFAAKQEFLKNSNILSISSSNHLITGIYWNGHNWNWQGRNPETDPLVTYLYTDTDFLKTLDVEMSLGDFFPENITTDSIGFSRNIVINETFAGIIGSESPVGQTISQNGPDLTIIGVVKDFNFKPLHTDIGPLILFYNPANYNFMYFKIQPADVAETIKHIERVHNQFNPGFPFEYRFLDEDFARLYRGMERFGSIFQYFAALAIFISCLGLFGLASYMAEQRTKEIGIRKALGASTSGIVLLLSKDFAKWVLIANAIALPAAWYYMSNWLEDYAYRIDIGWSILIISGGIALVIAILTTGYQSIKAARTNPADSLRCE